MRSLGLGTAGDRVLFTAAREITGRFKVTMNVDDDGRVFLKGATDTNGYSACGKDGCPKRYPCAKHGPHGNPQHRKGRTIDPLAAAWGFTQGDVAGVRADLANIGIHKTKEQAFALLMQARFVLDGGTLPRARKELTLDERRARERDKKRRRRARMRERGQQCIVCCSNPVVYIEDLGRYGSTCYPCGRAANQRKRAQEHAS